MESETKPQPKVEQRTTFKHASSIATIIAASSLAFPGIAGEQSQLSGLSPDQFNAAKMASEMKPAIVQEAPQTRSTPISEMVDKAMRDAKSNKINAEGYGGINPNLIEKPPQSNLTDEEAVKRNAEMKAKSIGAKDTLNKGVQDYKKQQGI